MWNGLMRRDGVHVSTMDTTTHWVVCDSDGRILTKVCPCCDYPIETERAAKLVADGFYPMRPEAA